MIPLRNTIGWAAGSSTARYTVPLEVGTTVAPLAQRAPHLSGLRSPTTGRPLFPRSGEISDRGLAERRRRCEHANDAAVFSSSHPTASEVPVSETRL